MATDPKVSDAISHMMDTDPEASDVISHVMGTELKSNHQSSDGQRSEGK